MKGFQMLEGASDIPAVVPLCLNWKDRGSPKKQLRFYVFRPLATNEKYGRLIGEFSLVADE